MQRRAFLLVHLALQAQVLALGLAYAHDPDLGFHLANGRSILDLGHLPATNVLTFAEPEAMALQSQWLAAVLFELTYRWLGIAGPILLKCAVLAATAAVLVETARTLGARASATLFALSLAILVASDRFVERPLVFSNLALAVVAWGVAVRISTDDPKARRRAMIATVVALALTVHLHGGAVFGFLLLAALAIAHLGGANERLARSFSLDLHEARAYAIGLLAAIVLAAATLFAYHPHAARVLSVPFTMASDPFLREHLVEFRPPSAFPPETLASYWILAALVTIAIALSIRTPAVALVMAFGLALSLRHVRFQDLLALLGAPGLALVITRLMTRGERTHGEAAALALGLCVFTATALVVLERDASGFGFDPRVFPRALMRDVRELGVRGPAFVQDGWAGPYLGFRYPRERVFFHPAFDCYSNRFFRESYLRTRDGEPGWDRTLDRHGVRLVLMKYTSEGEARRQRGRPNLRQRLARDPRWALVSFDEYGLAFARRATLREGTPIIEGVDVDAMRFTGDPRRALPGLRALASRGMRSSRAFALGVRAAIGSPAR